MLVNRIVVALLLASGVGFMVLPLFVQLTTFAKTISLLCGSIEVALAFATALCSLSASIPEEKD